MYRLACPLDECGLFYYVGSRRTAMPLDGVHVSARIVNLVAEVQVVQFYVNPTNTVIDTKYTFPLDESAAVCGFEAELDDKLLIGEVREKEEARAEYNAAISRGETAALLEQDKADVFTQRIGNIKPYSRVNIRITYVADLKVESDGAVRFILPTAVAPRYAPHGPTYEGFVTYVPWKRSWRHSCLGRRVLYYDDYNSWVRRGTFVYTDLPWCTWNYYTPEYVLSRDKPCSFSVTLEIEMPSAVVDMESTTHTLKWERGAAAGSASASFWHDTEPMGKDLVLRIYQQKTHEPHAQVEVAPDGSGCAMVTMVPEFDMEPEPTEIVFLVDCSGSMSGQRIQAAVRALQVFLRALPMTCHFNIVKFGTSHNSLFSGASQAYTQHTLQQASKHVAAISANLGGTEILRPLNEIFKRSVAGGGRARQVFVLTDGEVSNTEAVIEACRRNAHNSRVFTVGIGDQVSRSLVEGMARAATGTAEFILGTELSGSSGALEAKLLNQLKLATQPSLTKVLIDWGKLGSLSPPVASAPVVVPAPSAATTSTAVTTSSTSSPSVLSTGRSVGSGSPSLLTVKVVCNDTRRGEDLCITGDNPALGSWNHSSAVVMNVDAATEGTENETWLATVLVSAGSQLAFKFIKRRRDGSSTAEAFEGNREVVVPLSSEAVFDAGKWDEKPAPASGSPTRLTVRVVCSDTRRGEELCLTGDHPVLGTWDTAKAVVMNVDPSTEGTEDELWATTVIVPSGANLLFKFIKKRRDGSSTTESFEGHRTVVVPSTSEAVFDAGKWNQKPAPSSSTVTIKVICNDTRRGEDLCITGADAALGSWDANNAVIMNVDAATEGTENETWLTTVVLPAGAPIPFKFLKKRRDGSSTFESFDDCRLIPVAISDSIFNSGKWNEKPALTAPSLLTNSTISPSPVTPLATSSVAAAPPASMSHSVHMGGGVMMTGPSSGASVSRFFQTGPQRAGGFGSLSSSSINSVGSGPALHSPSSLAPAVSAYNDASSAQQHGRNGELYQAPFLPPPIFSNTRFVMYAFFSPGCLPMESIRISCESPEGPMDIDVPITKLTTVGKTLHYLAAKALIRDLEDGTSHLHYRRTNTPASRRGGGGGGEESWFKGWFTRGGVRNAVGGAGQDRASTWGLEPVTPAAHVVRAEMIDLGVKFGIVSTATSFVAVERWRDGHLGSSPSPLLLPSQQQQLQQTQHELQLQQQIQLQQQQLQQQQQQQQQQRQHAPVPRSSSTAGSAGGYGPGYGAGPGSGSAAGRGGGGMRPAYAGPASSTSSYKATHDAGKYAPPTSPSSSSSFLLRSNSASASANAFDSFIGGAAPPPAPAAALSFAPTTSAPMSYGFANTSASVQSVSSPKSFAFAPTTQSEANSAAFGGWSDSTKEAKCEERSSSSMKRKKASVKSLQKDRNQSSSSRARRMSAEAEKQACCDQEEEDFDSFSSLSSPVDLLSVVSGPPPTDLFMQQQFDGSFIISDSLASLLHTTAANLRSGASTYAGRMGSVDVGTSQSVWACIFVVAMFQKLWYAYERNWEMTADKAKQFCVSALTKSLGDRAAARRLVDELIVIASA